MHIVIRKQPLVIFGEYDIPLPYSHWFETRLQALKWMTARGLQAICCVVDVAKYQKLGGYK